MASSLTLALSIATSVIVVACTPHVQSPTNSSRLVWFGTREFDDEAARLTLSPKAAHDLLVSKTRGYRYRYFDQTPVFIYGNEYFFADISKTDVALEGFYIDGMTGKASYRTSTK